MGATLGFSAVASQPGSVSRLRAVRTDRPATVGTGRTGSASLAASGPGDGLVDVIVEAARAVLKTLFYPVEAFIEAHGNALLQLIVGTPAPDAVFATPTNPPWPGLYEFYWQQLLPVALFLYGLMVGVVILLESTSHVFGSYHRSKLKKRAVAGLVGILSWWWIAALSLQLVSALTGYLAPDLSEITLFQTLSFTGLGLLGTIVALGTDLVLFLLVGLIYFLRVAMLYLYVLLMPLLIALWVPGVGPLAPATRTMKRFAGFYVPFLFMPVPVALLFRVAHILGTRGGGGLGGVGAWLSALVIPFLAVLLPFIMVWQVGAAFFVVTRSARHVSRQTGTGRLARGRSAGQDAVERGHEILPRVPTAGSSPADGRRTLARVRARVGNPDTERGGAGRLRGWLPGRSNGGQSGVPDDTRAGGTDGNRPGADGSRSGPSSDQSNAGSGDRTATGRSDGPGDRSQPDVTLGALPGGDASREDTMERNAEGGGPADDGGSGDDRSRQHEHTTESNESTTTDRYQL